MNSSHGAPSFQLKSDCVELSVTQTAGMLAPVIFRSGGSEFSPYALAPWKPDELEGSLPNLLKYLRGDFFCLPFGPQDNGDPHGDTANAEWSLVKQGEDLLHLAIEPGDVGGRIEKVLRLKSGHAAVYCEHRISGIEGHFSYGNHPILDFSGLAEGQGRVTTSSFRWASVNPGLFSDPANDEYQALVPGARFTDLREVPLATEPPSAPDQVSAAGTTDLTCYPARQGFEDLVMLVNEEANKDQPFAWTAAVLDGCVWFSLKNPADFPATLFWISNGGRRGAPWDGRHLGRLGLEEVCSHFADNVTSSREDKLDGENIPTTRSFSRNEVVSLRIVQAVTAIPADFGAVASIVPGGPENVTITSDTGAIVKAAVDWSFAA
ncbi:MAG TPA: hypothetical protein DCS85_08300 [Verrucomicrobiales bacterium]|nr:hypothetical protein [Verrucomicrobiales bacterium]